MADWSSKLERHSRKEPTTQSTTQSHAQQQTSKMDKPKQEVRQLKQALSNMSEPIAEAEQELKSGFEEKLQAGKHGEWTMDEVSLFLHVCGMEDTFIHQRTKLMERCCNMRWKL